MFAHDYQVFNMGRQVYQKLHPAPDFKRIGGPWSAGDPSNDQEPRQAVWDRRDPDIRQLAHRGVGMNSQVLILSARPGANINAAIFRGAWITTPA
jgi:hypothetical protein